MGASFSKSSSQGRPETVSPFGNRPYRTAGGFGRQFSDPLSAFFGAEPQGLKPWQQRRYDRQMSALEEGTGPLAQFARQARDYLPQVFGQASNAGSQIASFAPQLFDQLRGQINSGLSQLAGAQNNAQRMVDQSQSPIQSQALYQDALRNALEGSRGGAAARGLLDAGAAQQGEQEMGRDLANQFAQRRFQEQQAALGTQAGLIPMGAQLAGYGQQGLQGLAQGLQAGYQMPMQALQDVFSQLSAFQNPQLALLAQILPTVASRTSSKSFSQSAGI